MTQCVRLYKAYGGSHYTAESLVAMVIPAFFRPVEQTRDKSLKQTLAVGKLQVVLKEFLKREQQNLVLDTKMYFY